MIVPGWVARPLTVEWRDFPETRQRVRPYADKLLETLAQAEQEMPDFKLETG